MNGDEFSVAKVAHRKSRWKQTEFKFVTTKPA